MLLLGIRLSQISDTTLQKIPIEGCTADFELLSFAQEEPGESHTIHRSPFPVTWAQINLLGEYDFSDE